MSTCYPLLLVLSALCVEIPSLCLESTLKRWNGQHENNTSSKWMNINCKDTSDHPNQNVNLSYLSIGLVFCCFGQFENSLLNLIYIFLPTSFRGKRLLIRQMVSEWQGIIIHSNGITKKSESETKGRENWGTPRHSERVETEMTI